MRLCLFAVLLIAMLAACSLPTNVRYRCEEDGGCVLKGTACVAGFCQPVSAVDGGPDEPDSGACLPDHSLCWENPRPFGLDVLAIHAVGEDEAWFVTRGGGVAHYHDDLVEGFVLADAGALVSVAGDDTRVLAVDGVAVFDLVSKESAQPSGGARPRFVHALGDGRFVVGGDVAGAPRLYALDTSELGLTLPPLYTGPQALTLRGVAGGPGNLWCSLGSGGQGSTWHQTEAADLSAGWQVEPPGAELTSVTVDGQGQPWVGTTDLSGTYLVRSAAGVFQGFDAGFPGSVTALASDALVSLVVTTLPSSGLRCSAPGQCARVLSVSEYLTATATRGATQFFGGQYGGMYKVGADAGVTELTSMRDYMLRDLLVEADGGAWAVAVAIRNTGSQLWRREGGRWVVAVTTTSQLTSIARVGGALFVGSATGLLQELPDGTLEDAVVFLPDGGPGTFAISCVRAVGEGGLAVGRGSATMSYRPNPRGGEWWIEKQAGWLSGQAAMGAIIDLGGGDALMVGSTQDFSGGAPGLMVARLADGRTFVVDAGTPLTSWLGTGTVLEDGGVLACGLQGFSVEGSLATGFTPVEHPDLTNCGDMWRAPDNSLYVTANYGVAQVGRDPLRPWRLKTIRFWALDRVMGPVAGDDDDVWAGGAAGTIVRLNR